MDLEESITAPIVVDKAPKEVVKAKNKFVAGQSGNPKGRPKGSKNKTTLMKAAIEKDITETIGGDVVSVLEKAVELALEGDTAMIKLVADKFIPNAKLADEKGGKGFGGINITIGTMEEKPAINAEIIDEENDDE